MKQEDQSGFTLIEVMIAILTLAIVAIGAAALLSQTGTSIWKNAHSRTSTVVANDILEGALKADYDTLSTSTETVARNGITYTVATVVSEQSMPINHKDVVVSVSQNGETISARTYVIKGFEIQN